MSREKSQKDNRNDSKSSRNHNYLIKLRGISNSLIKDDIKKFLHRKLTCVINQSLE